MIQTSVAEKLLCIHLARLLSDARWSLCQHNRRLRLFSIIPLATLEIVADYLPFSYYTMQTYWKII